MVAAQSLPPTRDTLGYLGIKFISVVDEAAVQRYGGKVQRRDERLVRNGGTAHRDTGDQHPANDALIPGVCCVHGRWTVRLFVALLRLLDGHRRPGRVPIELLQLHQNDQQPIWQLLGHRVPRPKFFTDGALYFLSERRPRRRPIDDRRLFVLNRHRRHHGKPSN
jgi:hypothetical protein